MLIALEMARKCFSLYPRASTLSNRTKATFSQAGFLGIETEIYKRVQNGARLLAVVLTIRVV